MNQRLDTPVTIALVTGVGMFLSTLDTGIINVALPGLIKVFNTNLSTVIWTFTFYIFALSSSILFWANLADKKGRLKIYIFGLIFFAVSSLLCGLAQNIMELIIFRGLQGLSAAMLQATAIAIITTRLQEQDKVKAMSLMGILIGLGPLLGPVLGGFILSSISWRWIFLINIPICLLGLYGCSKLEKNNESLQKHKFNYRNLVLLSLSILSILIFLHQLSINAHYVISLAISTFFVVTYFIFECVSKNKLIPLSLFKHLNFSAPMLAIAAFSGATAVTFILPPLYFETVKNFPMWQVGLLCLSVPVGLVTSARLVIKFVPIFGTLKLMMVGMLLMTVTLLSLTQMKPIWPDYFIVMLLLGYGIGGGMFQTLCYLHVNSQFTDNKQAFITSLTRMFVNLSMALESAAVAVLISLQTLKVNTTSNFLTGIQYGWWFAGGILFLAALILFFNLRKA